MSKSKFPKERKYQEAELEVFKHILEHLSKLEKRIQRLEIKIAKASN